MFAGGVDTNATETKGTVLIHSASQVSFSFTVWKFHFVFPRLMRLNKLMILCD